MRKPLIRTAAGLLGGLLTVLAMAPAGLAFAQTTETVEDVIALDEAWFFKYRQPLEPVPQEVGPVAIDDPSGNQADDIVKSEIRNRTNPYPGDTLHVGVNGGQPEAETFIAWDLLALNGNNGLSAIVAGGTVTFTDAETTCLSSVPEGAPEDARAPRSCGSRNVEDADMVACPATGLIVETQGGDWKDKYPYNAKDCAPLEPVEVKEGEAAQWTLSLDQWADLWSDPFKNYGIAIVPNPEIEPPSPTEWHVAFHGRRTDVEDAALITADLKIIKQKLPDFGSFPTFPEPSGGEVSGPTFSGTGTSGGDTGFTSTPPSSGSSSFTPGTSGAATSPAPPPPAAPVAGAPPAAQAAPPVAAPGAAAVQPTSAPAPYTSPAIWLLPALGLALAGALGWSLTQPVELAAEREGAVSKLMKARRLGRAS